MIRVEIDINDFPPHFTLELWEGFVISKLKEAGVPVKGTLLFGGVERGTLIRYDDPADFEKIIYEWRGQEKKDDE